MGLTEEQVGIKMRLIGANEYVAGMDKSTEATVAYGDAAEKAGAQAKQGAVGVDMMAASNKRGVSSMTKTGSALKGIGSKMTAALTVPIALIGGVSIKMALDFNESMALIQTQAGASAKELKFLELGIKGLAASGKTGFTDNELAEAMYAIRSSGIKGAKALLTLKSASDFAEIGQANLAETTKALVSAQNSGIHGTESLHKEMGTLNATIGAGQMHMGELNSAISTGFLGTAKALGLNLTEVGGALSFLTREGTPASAAATRLRMAFSLIANPTEKAVEALNGIGLSQAALALKMRGPNGAVNAFKLLNEHLKENFDMTTKKGQVEAKQVLAGAFGGAKSGGTILQLLGNMKKLEETTAAVHNNTGMIGSDLKKAEATGEEKLKHTWSQFNNALVELGQVLIPIVIPALRKVATFMTGAVTAFSHLPGPVKTAGVILLGLLAVAGPLLSMLGMMTLGVEALGTALEFLAFNPVGIVIVAVAAAAVGFALLYTKVKWFHNAVNAVVSFLVAHPWIGLLLGPIPQLITGIILIVTHFSTVVSIVKSVIHFFELLPKRAVAGIKALPNLIKNFVIKAIIFLAVFPIKAPIYFVQFGIKMVGILIGLLPKLIGIGGKMASAIGHGIASGASAIWGFIRTLPGKFASAVASIASALMNVGGSIAKSIASGIKNELSSILPGPVKDALKGAAGVAGEVGGFLGFATGTKFAPGGMALVGERGPELVNLPRGSEVITASRTRDVMDGAGATVGPLRYRGGPSPMQAGNGRVRGAGRAGRGVRQPINVEVKVGRRKFGEAMVMAMIDDEENQ